ncbi:MAG TPA: aldo/keto reductase [Candidatus Thermoplasmatota archaeon]|nr:aldo/keto reductase [Candidatus Thermoplasmatota archaeon]
MTRSTRDRAGVEKRAPDPSRKPFGSTGVEVSAIGQGTWQLRDPRRAEEALRAGLEAGLDHIDTAELYVGSEAVIAKALAGRPRDDVFLVSKVLPKNATRRGTIKACDASLERLATDHVDVYLLHWWDGDKPLAPVFEAFAELIDDGKTRFVGVSNFDVEELERAQEVLPSGVKLVCNQVLYHLGDRAIENEVLPWCERHDMAVVGYSPFGSARGRWPPGGRAGAETLEAVAAKHGKTPRQVALNFLTRRPSLFAIPKAENPEHVRENAGALGWTLDAEDVAAIDAAFPVRRGGLGFL